MANVPNAVEILPKITTARVGCTSVTDNRQTTDRRATAHSERECSSSSSSSTSSSSSSSSRAQHSRAAVVVVVVLTAAAAFYLFSLEFLL